MICFIVGYRKEVFKIFIMKIILVEFVMSNSDVVKCLKDRLLEYVFIG